MKWFRVATLLLAVLLLQPGCKKKPPKEDSIPPVTEVVEDVAIVISAENPSPREAPVKDKKQQNFYWKSQDQAYVIRFKEDQWQGISGTTDGTETTGGVNYVLVRVPAGGNTGMYSLDYTAPPEKKWHHYRVDTDPPATIGKPPNGPAIIGGD